jgi:WD40 repeat protein
MDIQAYLYENNPSEILPKDLFFEISKFLSPTHLNMTRCVSKLWKTSSDQDIIWEYQSKNKWGSYVKLTGITWKQHFQSNYNGSKVGNLSYLDNNIVITFNRTITFFNLQTNKGSREKTSHTGSLNQFLLYDNPHLKIKFLTCGSDGSLKIWDDKLGSKNLFSEQVHSRSVTCMQIIRKFLFTASEDCTVKVWQLDYLPTNTKAPYSLKLKNELKGHDGAITCFHINKEFAYTHVFTGSRDKTINIFEVRIGKSAILKQTLKGHRSAITALTVHPSTGCLISGSVDKTIKIWIKQNNSFYYCTQTLIYHLGTVTTLLTVPLKIIFLFRINRWHYY